MTTLMYKLIASVVGAFFAAGTLYLVVQYIQDSGKQEDQLENLTDQLRLREQIDESVRTSPRDVQSAIELLRRRQNP